MDIFSSQNVQKSIIGSNIIQLLPNGVTNNATTYDYSYTGTDDAYVDFSSIKVVGSFRVTDEKGGELPADAPVTVINDIGETFISQCDIVLNGTQVGANQPLM